MENNTKQIKKNVKPIKTKKPKRKMSKLNLWATIIAVIVCIGLIGVTIGLITVANMLRTKPELDVSKFTNSESSVIYDENGDMVAELGATIRENVSYNELPQILVDAFVAVEDSRFFEHNGFDVPQKLYYQILKLDHSLKVVVLSRCNLLKILTSQMMKKVQPQVEKVYQV